MLRLQSISFLLFIMLCGCRTEQKNEDPFTQTIEIEDAQSDFSIFRNILEEAHPALTEYLSPKQKNHLFDSLYKSIHSKTDLREFYHKLNFLVNEIGCSHTYVSWPAAISDTLNNRKLFFPFPLIRVDKGVYANSDHVVKTGTKILMIDNVPMDRILDSLMLYNSIEGNHRETQLFMAASNFGAQYYNRFGGKKEFELLVKDTSGRIRTIIAEAVDYEVNQARELHPSYYDAMDVPFAMFQHPNDDFARLRIATFEFNSAAEQSAYENFLINSFELLNKKPEIKTLVIDLRNNTGGDLYNCFLLYSYLANQSFSEYKSLTSRIDKIPYRDHLVSQFDSDEIASVHDRLSCEFTKKEASRFFTPDTLIEKWEPNPLKFKGKLVLIVNPQVASAASYFSLLVQNTGRGKIVGYETNGGNYSGNGFSILKYVLPKTGFEFGFPYVNILYSNGSEKSGKGIIPDFRVEDDWESFQNNKDRQLNFIIDSLLKN